ncbi:hypothetical protein, partial [Caballeronia sp. NCTM1]|uniref:hypothetical protein n=1 Tax=Caballeronia sp. NCTM1 TaxID=2921753 RepID=UPI002028389C
MLFAVVVFAGSRFLCGLLALPLCGAAVTFLAVVAGSRFLSGLLALPLCGAALTFFAAAKKVSKESSFSGP